MTRLVSLFTVLAFVLCWISAAKADNAEFTAGVLRPADPQEYVPETCNGTKPTVCQSCNAIQVCVEGSSTLNLTRTCPSSTPYCVQSSSGSTCQSSPDAQCTADAANGFVCTSTGFFPDPTSCQVYHYCEKEGDVGDTYDCPSGYRYNSQRKTCQLWGWNRRCETVKCDPTSQNVFAAYPYDDEYYIYCQYDYTTDTPTYQKTYVLSCGKGSKFDAKNQVCKFQCRKVGLFVNTVNPSQYYSCYRNRFQWEAKVNTCSKPNYIFDEELMRCKEDPNATATMTEGEVMDQYQVASLSDSYSTNSAEKTTPASSSSSISTDKPTKVEASSGNPVVSVVLADTVPVRRDCLQFLKDLMQKNNILK
ncbi:uncharacterized protein LOC109406559 [Aedes albopictus]|uniref:Chitin-binding type-2 domain-containing protein n=1 Tax=Aedes albopictus TaxID=7160 RepID=A0ABM1Z4I7_AEDAL|nr:uncharacterized protein LOC109406559 [Aedes albopictus]KXJ62457.1 hypothetical protein RP20_CCG008841 [Aedes albopictus]